METFVHVWPIKWNSENMDECLKWMEWLSEEEKNKAERFVRQSDRYQYIVAHGFCRLILSRYVKQQPHEIQYGQEQKHKPIVVLKPDSPTVHFNLSHAGKVAVVAVSNRPVGIDVEWMDASLVRVEMVEQFMSEQEKSTFFRLPTSQQKEAFYRCWTRKEAYVKALGEGLFYPIRKITVPLGRQPVRSWTDDVRPDEPQKWNMEQIETPPGYMGAVVHQGQKVVCNPLKTI